MITTATENEFEYPTKDTTLASYLIALGYEHLIIRYDESGIGTHIFNKDCEQILKDIAKYRRQEAEVNVALYEKARHNLLDRVKHQLP